MWYDATSAAGSLEAKDSPVAGKIGYAPAPVKLTKNSGWLYAWSWAIEKASKNKDDAWKFVSWASSKGYENLVGTKMGWAACRPASGRRRTRTRLPQGRALVRQADADRDPEREPGIPGVQPRPTIGIQFVDIPEFTDFGTACSQEISSAIAGKESVKSALETLPTSGRGRRQDLPEVAEDERWQHRYRRRGTAVAWPPSSRRSAAPGGPPTTSARAVGAPRAAAARADLHDHRHPAAVRGDLGHVVPELERAGAGDPGLGRPGQLQEGVHRSGAALGGDLHHRAHRTVVFVSLVLGMAIALLLDRAFFGRGIVRTMMITPFLIVPVAAALLFKHGIYNASYGLINGTLTAIWELFGGTAPQPDWLTEYPKIMIEVQLIWQWTPFMMLILLAGLQSRDSEVMEAARVDGASWQMFRYITMPHMRQYLELAGLLGTIYIVQTFDSVFVITSGGLGTANMPYTIYQFFSAHDYGLASAQGVVVVIGSLIVATLACASCRPCSRGEPDDDRSSAASRRGHRHCGHAQRRAGSALLGLLAWIIGLLFIIPVLYMILTSFHSEADASTNPPSIAAPLTLDGLPRVLAGHRHQPWPYLANSLTASVISTLLVLLLALPAAYALSIRPVRKWRDVMFFFLSTKMLPLVAGLLPLYLIAQDLTCWTTSCC